MTLANKVCVLTGATGGVGRHIANVFSKAGASLVLVARDQTKLDALAQSLEGDHLAVACDVTDLSALDHLAGAVKAKFGRVDSLITCAGKADELTPFSDVTEALYNDVMDLNIKGTFFTVNKLQHLLAGGASVTLMAAMCTSRAWPNHTVYTASKSAVRGFAVALAAELAKQKIRVNTISPGPTETQILDDLENRYPGLKQDLREKYIPLGSIGQPEHIAKLALFLASDDASFMTGEDLRLDGGMSSIWV